MSAVAEEEEGAGPAATFEFDEDFQKKILLLQVQDSTFAAKTDGLIEPSYFEQQADQVLCTLIQTFYRTYKKAPSASTMPFVLKSAIQNKKLRKDMAQIVVERWREIKDGDVSDADFVTEEVVNFAKRQAHINAAMEIVGLVDTGNYEQIGKVIQKAALVGLNDDDDDYDYWEEIENRTQERKDIAAGLIKPDGIPTGYKEIDELLYHGGWGRKELSLLMAPAKGGKSMGMGDFAKNASLLGYNVLYVTLEVSKKIISDRLDAALSDTLMKALKNTPFDVEKKVKAAHAKAGKLKIREFASGTLKCSQLRRILERYRQKGIIFDLIVVDYADIMAAEYHGELRDEMRQIYIDLRAIAHDYNAAVLSATQTNRSGAEKTTSSMTDVAEDFNKIRTADVVIAINATENEKKSGEARLTWVAVRNGEGGVTLQVKQDRARMQFIQKILGRV